MKFATPRFKFRPKHTEETKRLMSILAKSRVTDEMRERMAELGRASKGRKASVELRAKLSLSHKGQKRRAVIYTEELRKKLSEAHKGRHHLTLEQRKHLSEFFIKKYQVDPHPMLGRKLSKEWMSKFIRPKGWHHTEQAKTLMREARLRQVLPMVDTSIERKVQEGLRQKSIVFQTQVPIAQICQADIAIPAKHLAIFCDGDYWHSIPKAIRNDKRINEVLAVEGWQVLRFWEHEINADIARVIGTIETKI